MVAVTLLLAAISKGAWLAPPLTELAMEPSRAEALAADRVAGGSLLTLTDSLATRSIEARGAGVLASLTVEARTTVASTRGGLTGAIVLTGALEEAGSTIVPSRAGLLTVWPHPAQGAGAAAISSVTQPPISAGAFELTVLAKTIPGTPVFTADSSLPRRTRADP